MPTFWWLDTLKKVEKIIRESALDKKKESVVKFNPGLALTSVQTTGPWRVNNYTTLLWITWSISLSRRDSVETNFKKKTIFIITVLFLYILPHDCCNLFQSLPINGEVIFYDGAEIQFCASETNSCNGGCGL